MTEERPFKFANDGLTTLNGAINAVQTAIVVTDGAEFPAPAAGEIVTLVLRDDANDKFEIVNLTARSGNNLTVERGAEGTTAQTWPSGTPISNSITAAFFEKLSAPGPDRFRTSKPYPYIFDDSMDCGGTMIKVQPALNIGRTGVSGDSTPDSFDNGGTMVSGILDTLLLSYTDGAPEEIDSSGTMLSGVLDSVLIAYEEWPPEELDVSGNLLSGVLDTVLLTYSNYQPESIDNGGTIVSGVLS